MDTLTIASRKSPLALAQSHAVASALQQAHPTLKVHIATYTTTGDQFLDKPLQAIGGKGLFTKELEQALYDEVADIAVHSAKDVPYVLPEGLAIGAFPSRHDPRDIVVLSARVQDLPAEHCIGTVSLRRSVQWKSVHPEAIIQPVRGNLSTRLKRLDAGEFDALILAAAGLQRLDWSHRISWFLEPSHMVPAAGQGALAIEYRHDRKDVRAIIESLNDPLTAYAVLAERAFCARLGASCLLPVGVHAHCQAEGFHMQAVLGRTLDAHPPHCDGSQLLRHRMQWPFPVDHRPEEASLRGSEFADWFLARGAAEWIHG